MEEPSLGSLGWAREETGGLSGRHILRMANEGKFPKPVRVTEGSERQKGRIAFVRSEVKAWIAARIAERSAAVKPANCGGETDVPKAAGVRVALPNARAKTGQKRRRLASPAANDPPRRPRGRPTNRRPIRP
jgi:predicted DNA-binding transcriptional regulator AlpA